MPRLKAMHRYRWAILAVGVGAQAAVAGLRLGLPSLGPSLRDAFALSLPEVGLVFTSVAAGIVLTLIVWGALADRVGERPVLAWGLAGTAVALAGAAFAPAFPALLIALLVAGMLAGSATGASGRAVMGWFPRSERGMALGVRQMGMPLGGGLAAVALPLLAGAWGLRAAFLALAAGCLAAALASARWMREAPPPPADRPRVQAPPPLRDRRLWRLSAGSALLLIAQSGMLGFIVLFLHDERGWSAAAAAGVLAAFHVGGSVARVLAGRWSDRLDERIAPMRRIALASAALIAAAAALGALPTVFLLPVLIAGGILAMSWNGLSLTAAAEMAGRERAGTAMSLQNTVVSAAAAVAPVAFASVVVATSWPLAWLGLAISQLAGVGVLGPLVGEEDARRRARADRARSRAAAESPGGLSSSATPSTAGMAQSQGASA